MFTRKINYIWAVNLILFISVVFLGIEQASKGAEISNSENKLVVASLQKQQLSEEIFQTGDESKLTDNALSLGFNKPSKIYYINSIDVSLTLK